jgi:hypothetical protein
MATGDGKLPHHGTSKGTMTAAVIPFPSKPEAPGFVERLVRAIDAQLPQMSDDATRLRVLEASEHRWTLRYLAFRNNVAEGRYDETNGPTATDYVMAISEISMRRHRLEMKLRSRS